MYGEYPPGKSPHQPIREERLQGQMKVCVHPLCRVQLLRGRASDSRLIEPGFESCATVLKLGQVFHSILLQFTQLYK